MHNLSDASEQEMFFLHGWDNQSIWLGRQWAGHVLVIYRSKFSHL